VIRKVEWGQSLSKIASGLSPLKGGEKRFLRGTSQGGGRGRRDGDLKQFVRRISYGVEKLSPISRKEGRQAEPEERESHRDETPVRIRKDQGEVKGG